MRDHTFDGVPVAQLSTEYIHECLADGICVNHLPAGYTEQEAIEAGMERLRIELLIRSLGLR